MTLIDKLPTPFGLVRYGVAPDHQEVKSVMTDFTAVAEDERVTYIGGVTVGEDVSVAQLREVFDGVVLAYGAQGDRSLGLPGEDLRDVWSSRTFVNWYNGHPDLVDFEPDLDVEDVVIIGQGNVAIDCARVLSKTVDELAVTDMADHALEALSKSRVKRVHLVGRRGHVQAAFTMKELREITKLEATRFVVDSGELERGRTEASLQEISEQRARKRMDALLETNAEAGALDRVRAELAAGPNPDAQRELIVRFMLSPTEFVPSVEDPARVGSVRLHVTRLEGEAGAQRAVNTDETEEISAGLVLKSIGYKSLPLPGVSFDDARATVRSIKGRVVGEDGSPEPGMYCAGWVKRGPSGIIGTNIPDARETVAAIVADANSGDVVPRASATAAASGFDDGAAGALRALLRAGGRVDPDTDTVDWGQYAKLNAAETEAGEAAGRPRRKIVHVDEMLRVAHGKA